MALSTTHPPTHMPHQAFRGPRETWLWHGRCVRCAGIACRIRLCMYSIHPHCRNTCVWLYADSIQRISFGRGSISYKSMLPRVGQQNIQVNEVVTRVR
jgi:hypothetical protein